MGTKKIKFNVPSWMIVLIGGLNKALDTVVIIGTGGVAMGSDIQLIPQVTFGCVLARVISGYILKAWIDQAITQDDK